MEKKAAIEPELVNEFVSKAHSNLPRVKALMAQEPMLINAVWDWGGGDWETALGAASHMGRRDIALYLLEHGARIDLFAAAMLGYLEIVQAMFTAFPQMRHQTGPHGIPLLSHAQKGGKEAEPVVAFLQAQTLDSVS
jgi:hypothetical protein